MSTSEKKKESIALNANNTSKSDRISGNTQDLQEDLDRRLERLGPSTPTLYSTTKVDNSNLEIDKKSNENSVRLNGVEQENFVSVSSPSPRPAIVMNKSILLVSS